MFTYNSWFVFSCAPSTLKFVGNTKKIKDCFYFGIGENSKFGFWRSNDFRDYEKKDAYNYVLVLEDPECYIEFNNYILLERKGKQTIIETDNCKIRNIYSEKDTSKFNSLKRELNIPDSINFIKIDRKDYELIKLK